MIIDGKINTSSNTYKTDEIKEDCKKECETYIVSSDEWCDCMYVCIRNIINKHSLEGENVHLIIPVEGCSIQDFKKKLNNDN